MKSEVLSAPSWSTNAMPMSRSHTGLFHLSKAPLVGATNLRPSPSLSTLQQKPADAQHATPMSFNESHTTRVRSSSLISHDHQAPRLEKNSSEVVPLAERRRSQTSRYLGTDDFKSAFAINLLKLKERERVDPDVASHSDHPPKGAEMGTSLIHLSPSQLKPIFCDQSGPMNQPSKSEMMNSVSPADEVRVPEVSGQLQLTSAVGEPVRLPPEELENRIQMVFRRLKSDRMQQELEARNEVISILAHQLSNQLEANEKLIHELAALRAAYASLQSSCSDYIDELECLKKQSGQHIERSTKEAEEKVRHLRQLLEESKKAINRLQVEVRHQGRRQSLDNSYSTRTGTKDFSSATSAPVDDPLRSRATKRSTIHVLSSEPKQAEFQPPVGASFLEKLALQLGPDNAGARRSSISHKFLALTSLPIGVIPKPERPPKSAARSQPSSPAPLKKIGSQRPKDSVPVNGDDKVSAGDEELEELRRKCARLELELSESEDSRMASQVALDGLRAFISTEPRGDLSNIKLPPLPSDTTESQNTSQSGKDVDEENSNPWNLSNLLSRSKTSKSVFTTSWSPHLQSPKLPSSPILGGFSLWGRSPSLG